MAQSELARTLPTPPLPAETAVVATASTAPTPASVPTVGQWLESDDRHGEESVWIRADQVLEVAEIADEDQPHTYGSIIVVTPRGERILTRFCVDATVRHSAVQEIVRWLAAPTGISFSVRRLIEGLETQADAARPVERRAQAPVAPPSAPAAFDREFRHLERTFTLQGTDLGNGLCVAQSSANVTSDRGGWQVALTNSGHAIIAGFRTEEDALTAAHILGDGLRWDLEHQSIAASGAHAQRVSRVKRSTAGQRLAPTEIRVMQ